MESEFPQLLQRLYRRESAQRRGPCFVAVALALEKEIYSGTISPLRVVQLFGKPDYWCHHAGSGLFVYRFDHLKRGRNGDEWYYTFEDGWVISSGYNWRGVNDNSDLQTASEWPPKDWSFG